jgi:GTP cyclohydrolase II
MEESKITCQVATRIPTEFASKGANNSLRILLYTNSTDNKEHLALVFGDGYLSKSLQKVRAGDEDPKQRKIRGALVPSTNEAEALFENNSIIDKACAENSSVHQGPEMGQEHSTASYESDSSLPCQEEHVSCNSCNDSIDSKSNTANESRASPVSFKPLKENIRKAPLVRIHSSCLTGEAFGSLRCDCGEQLQESLRLMSKEGGVVVYMQQEGRGIGLLDKLKAYNLIDMGYDTYSANVALGHEPDERDYTVAAAILEDLGIQKIRLLTNNPDKIGQLTRDGVQIIERVPMIPISWQSPLDPTKDSPKHEMESGNLTRDGNSGENESEILGNNMKTVLDRDGYLLTKIKRMGHVLEIPSFLHNK